ncbi:MAG: hypothetical protein VKJ24_06565 [Synechococcales bacterium]|nr:hypothetical protein [Synechococcales bacterium]
MNMQPAPLQSSIIITEGYTESPFEVPPLEVAGCMDAWFSLAEVAPHLSWEEVLAETWGVPALDPTPSGWAVAIDRGWKHISQGWRSLKPRLATATGFHL